MAEGDIRRTSDRFTVAIFLCCRQERGPLRRAAPRRAAPGEASGDDAVSADAPALACVPPDDKIV